MELSSPDASGRRSPRPIAGSAFQTQADLVVLAFGYEVETGAVKVNPATGATPQKGVFAGGDCVTGPSLVSTAARAGLVAAQGMLRYFAGEPWDALAG
jgi:NADPH-dependent glutamate synthase beta subunit-like oxidoreductase